MGGGMGGGPNATPTDPNSFGGSRAAVASNAAPATPEWLPGLLGPSAAPAAPPVANLGFPTPEANPTAVPTAFTAPTPTNPLDPNAAASAFNPAPFKPSNAGPVGAAAPPPVKPAEVAPAGPDPNDWVYAGDLEQTLTPAGVMTGYGGSGAAGLFGVSSGIGTGFNMKPLAPGTKLEGAQIDQYNRIRRGEYDRYMKLYGVGYDMPEYHRQLAQRRMALNALMTSGASGG